MVVARCLMYSKRYDIAPTRRCGTENDEVDNSMSFCVFEVGLIDQTEFAWLPGFAVTSKAAVYVYARKPYQPLPKLLLICAVSENAWPLLVFASTTALPLVGFCFRRPDVENAGRVTPPPRLTTVSGTF